MDCLRCGTPMQYKGTDQIQLGKTGLVIYKRGFNSLRFSFMMEVDWLTKFPIGTSRPQINVSASLHHPASDSASWDESSLPFHGLICLDFEVLEPV